MGKWAHRVATQRESLPFTVYDKNAYVDQAEMVSNKRLGAALKFCEEKQRIRDAQRLGSPKTRLREKQWIEAKETMAERNTSSQETGPRSMPS